MSTFKNNFITVPENVRSIRHAMWLEIQDYCKEDFSELGIVIPPIDRPMEDDDLNQMADKMKVIDAKGGQSKLTEVLVCLEEMVGCQSDNFIRTVQYYSEKYKIEETFLKKYHLPDDEDLSGIELGILLQMHPSTSTLMQSYRNCLAMDHAKFEYFDCIGSDENEGEQLQFLPPQDDDIDNLVALYKENQAYKKDLRIKDFCAITKIDRSVQSLGDDGSPKTVTEWWFNINLTHRTIVSPHVAGASVKTVAIKPPKTDVVVVNPETQQIRINTSSEKRLSIYLKTITQLVCKQAFKCEKARNYTLAPLEREGWQTLFNPAGILGLNCVRLRSVEQCIQNENSSYNVSVKVAARRSLSDLSHSIDGNGAGAGLKRFFGVTRATIDFFFSGEANHPTIVKILGPNSIAIRRKHRAASVQMWLRKQGFIKDSS